MTQARLDALTERIKRLAEAAAEAQAQAAHSLFLQANPPAPGTDPPLIIVDI